jgi:hypothetical protein
LPASQVPPGQAKPQASLPEQASRPEWPILQGRAMPWLSLPEREKPTA